MSIFTSKINKNKIYRGIVSTTGLLVVLLFWQLVSRQFNSLVFPSPGDTYHALWKLFISGEMYTQTLITVQRTLTGYGLAIICGVFLAVILKASEFWQYFIRPIITIVQTIPPVVWLVLAVIWFGIADNLTPIFLIFVVTFPVIFINIFSGLDSIDQRLVEMARLYRCNRKQIILAIYLPALVPHLVSAVSVGLAFAWKATIFAEFIGSSSGIGFALSMANSNLETEKLFAWAIVLITLMLIFEYVIFQPIKNYV
ncbi:MAG: ABC transporter permease, partial [Halanaerobiaceae bacterium]